MNCRIAQWSPSAKTSIFQRGRSKISFAYLPPPILILHRGNLSPSRRGNFCGRLFLVLSIPTRVAAVLASAVRYRWLRLRVLLRFYAERIRCGCGCGCDSKIKKSALPAVAAVQVRETVRVRMRLQFKM